MYKHKHILRGYTSVETKRLLNYTDHPPSFVKFLLQAKVSKPLMKRALLVIDVQNEYFSGLLPITHPQGHLTNILRVMDAAAGNEIPVVVIQHTFPQPAMSDAELASMRKRASKLTLMPYSYFRLSSQSGYGAGNAAPAYFELLWEALQNDDLPGLPMRYLSQVARHGRESGTHRSTAEVIEGVRLAKTPLPLGSYEALSSA